MWIYKMSQRAPADRMIEIVFEADAGDGGVSEVALPAWRPGRYELGNFAKNVVKFSVSDEKGRALPFEKSSSQQWKIHSGSSAKIKVKYSYYANQPDAGACYAGAELLYVNPVHCCLYIPGHLNTPCRISLDVDSKWQVACSLKNDGKNNLDAVDFHELVDSPFIASPNLQHGDYDCNGVKFHIWFEGLCKPEWKTIIEDFKSFTEVQLKMMGSFPVNEYHFLILLLPVRFYHGVEHKASTVLALGPGNQLMHPSLYNNLMGVASHELFHAWNVKTLRPAEMNVYDYAKENYSRLGWVYEGFTTYYGDLFLARSNYFDAQGYLKEVSERLQKHFDNYGRYNLSVADSSFDTWLDGYVPGVPHRKTSIYDEGSLIALMLDLYIRRATDNKKSLDDLYVQLYKDFHDKGGYHEQDIRALAVELSDKEVLNIFDEYIHKAASYDNLLHELLDYCGCYISSKPSSYSHERYYGFRTLYEGGLHKVVMVAPGSPADDAGIVKDDEIVAVNGWKVDQDLSTQVSYFMDGEKPVELQVFSGRQVKNIKLTVNSIEYYPRVTVEQQVEATETQMQNFKSWTQK